MKWLKLIEKWSDQEEINYYYTYEEQIPLVIRDYGKKWACGSELSWLWENPPKEWLKDELDRINQEIWNLERYEKILNMQYNYFS